MSDLVDILRSLKRGPSSPVSTKAPYPTSPGGSLAARRATRGSQHSLSSATSNVRGNSSQQSSSTPEHPYRILVLSSLASTRAAPSSGAEPTSPTPSVNSYRRRLLSRSPRRLPSIPESELPSFGRTGTGWHHSRSPARANPSAHPESYGYTYREATIGRSSESLILTRDRRGEYTNPPTPPNRRMFAEKERFEYDTPPPSYQTLDSLDDDMVSLSKGFEDKPNHYYYSRKVSAYKTDPPLLSFLDMD